jgi:hypothetical protein
VRKPRVPVLLLNFDFELLILKLLKLSQYCRRPQVMMDSNNYGVLAAIEGFQDKLVGNQLMRLDRVFAQLRALL